MQDSTSRGSFFQTDWREKQQNISHILPVNFLFFYFHDQREHRSDKTVRGGMGREREAAWCTSKRGNVFLMCSHQMHIKIQHLKGLWDTLQVPAQKQGQMYIYIYICHLGDLMYTKTIQWGYPYFNLSLYFHKGNSYHTSYLIYEMTACLLIRHGFSPVIHNDIIRHAYQQCDLKVIVLNVCMLSAGPTHLHSPGGRQGCQFSPT